MEMKGLLLFEGDSKRAAWDVLPDDSPPLCLVLPFHSRQTYPTGETDQSGSVGV